jgi:hypothetical protein
LECDTTHKKHKQTGERTKAGELHNSPTHLVLQYPQQPVVLHIISVDVNGVGVVAAGTAAAAAAAAAAWLSRMQ